MTKYWVETATRFRVSKVLGVGVLVALCLPAKPSAACDREVAREYVTQPSKDEVAPELRSAEMHIGRARPNDDSHSSCSDTARYQLTVDASDDVTELAELGVSLTLLRGKLPFELKSYPLSSFGGLGQFDDYFSDRGGDFDAVVEVRIIDRAGNRSDPIELHVTGAAPDDAGGGCSSGPAHGRHASAVFAALALLGFARRRRGKHPAPQK
jgi:MYXO-CTERM domain-containing protein